MNHQQSDEDDLMRSDSPSTPSTPTNPNVPLRTSTAELQQIDLQSPPHSQETTPYLERSTSSLLTSDPQGGKVGNITSNDRRQMTSGKAKEEGGKPSWQTKRGIEEALQQSEKLLDQGFTTALYANIFNESDMRN